MATVSKFSIRPRKARATATVIAFCALLLIFQSAPAEAQIPVIPTPVIAAGSDLIANVKVDSVSDVTGMTLTLPEMMLPGTRAAKPAKPINSYFRTYKGTIEKILRDVSGKLKVGDKIEFLAMAPTPRPAGPGPQMRVTDGPSYPRLTEGQSYQLLMTSMDDGKSYYLPSYYKCFTPVERLKEVSADVSVDVDQWPWSKPDAAGLQMAVLLKPFTIASMAWRTRQPPREYTMIPAMFALRNTSDKPLRITADPSLKPLSVEITTAGGKPTGQSPDIYATFNGKLPAGANQPITLAPGQIIFIGEAGRGDWFSRILTTLPPGQYKVSATYTVAPPTGQPATTPSAVPGSNPNSSPIWSGTLKAPAVEFTVG